MDIRSPEVVGAVQLRLARMDLCACEDCTAKRAAARAKFPRESREAFTARMRKVQLARLAAARARMLERGRAWAAPEGT